MKLTNCYRYMAVLYTASQDHAQAKAALKALPDAGTGKDTPS